MPEQIVRKITLKTVAGKIDVEKLLKSDGKRMDLCDIFGIVRKGTPDGGDYGEFVRFSGMFKAVNHETGEVFRAGSAIFPPIAQDMIFGLLGEGVSEVAFGFRFSVRFDNDAVTKYVYEVSPLMKAAENDPLTMLENQIKAAQPALAALAADPEPVAETESASGVAASKSAKVAKK